VVHLPSELGPRQRGAVRRLLGQVPLARPHGDPVPDPPSQPCPCCHRPGKLVQATVDGQTVLVHRRCRRRLWRRGL